MPTFPSTTIAPALELWLPIAMVDPGIIEEVQKAIDSLEADIRAKIDRGEGQLTARTCAPGLDVKTGASIYSDALEAVVLCRGAVSRVTTAQEELGYLLDVVRSLDRARVLYVETSADEGGFGSATFHMIIREIWNLHESLAAIAEFLDTQATDVRPEHH